MKRLTVIAVVILALAVGGFAYFKYFRSDSTNPVVSKTQKDPGETSEPKDADAKDSGSKEGTSADNKKGTPPKVTVKKVDGPGIEATFGKAEGKAGDTVEVPLSFKGIPSIGLDGCDFVLAYDKNSLEFAGVEPGDIIPEITSFNSANEKEGQIKMAFLSQKETLKKEGIFAKLKFKIKSDAKPGNAFVKLDSVGSFVISDIDYIGELNSHFNDGNVVIH